MNKGVLVTGGGLAAIQSALDLADFGIKVTIAEPSSSLNVDCPGNPGEALRFTPLILRAAHHPNITLLTNASVERVRGEKGDFKIRLAQHPRYVNTDICVSCGKCEAECPVNVTPVSADKSEGHKAIHRPQRGLKSAPAAYIIDKQGASPCTAACPGGVNSHGYIALISQGKFTEALDLITDSVPFPRVLGRVCNRPCESKCTRAKVDRAISICGLKRFVADNSSSGASLKRTHNNNHNGHKGSKPDGNPRVAIIGAGPAGLAAARDLARMGHHSTVFEALPAPGGMITVGMPRFRLPREVRQADIEDIVRLGIEIKTNTPIGKDLTIADLKKQGYEAVLIAVGAHKNQKLGIPGETLSGVIDGLSLLRALNLKQPVTIGSRVIVIGGGNVATDSARVALRLGAKKVGIFYRRTREEMPANAEEVTEAEQEGVKFEYMVSPARIVGQDGKVTGVEFHRTRVTDDESGGRRHTAPIEGSEFIRDADTVIVAVGQRPDLSFLEGDNTLTEGKKHIVVDPSTMATKIPGIFAAGDAAHDSGPMINAIGMGRRAAISIDKYLRGEPIEKERAPARITPVEVNLDEIYIPPIKPQEMPFLPIKERTGNFEEVELGFTPEMAIKEAQRCLNCGTCSQCQQCVRTCELNAIDHSQVTTRSDLGAAAIVVTGRKPAADTPESTEEALLSADTAGPGIYFISPEGGASQVGPVVSEIMADLIEQKTVPPATIKTETATRNLPVMPQLTGEPRVGVLICRCGGNISDIVAVPDVVKSCRTLPGVALCGDIGYACTEESTGLIKELAKQHNLSHIVLAACSCCNFDQICFSCADRRVLCKSNLMSGNGTETRYEFVNIREHCAWVHRSQPEAATAKAKSLIKAGIARALEQQAVFNANAAIPIVDAKRCRACGTCVEICQFKAVSLKEKSAGIFVSRIDDTLCRGCGICVSACPSGALQPDAGNDRQINASLEAMLS